MLVRTGRKSEDPSPVVSTTKNSCNRRGLFVHFHAVQDKILHSLHSLFKAFQSFAHSSQIFASQLDVHKAIKCTPLFLLDLYAFLAEV